MDWRFRKKLMFVFIFSPCIMWAIGFAVFMVVCFQIGLISYGLQPI